MIDDEDEKPCVGDTLTVNGVPCVVVAWVTPPHARMPDGVSDRVRAAGRAAGVLVTTTDQHGPVSGQCTLCPIAAVRECPDPLPCGDHYIVPVAALPYLALEGVLL